MARTLFTNATLLDPEADAPAAGELLIEAGRIHTVLPAGSTDTVDAERVDLAGSFLAPGFVDLHHHGGFIFAEPTASAARIRASSASSARHGTTAFLPTTVAWARSELSERVTELVRVLGDGSSWPGAVPVGLHLEGPWINAVAAGAQPADGIRSFDPAEGDDLLSRADGMVRMVTLAPEIAGAELLQQRLGRAGVVMALGHSAASAEQSARAVDRGARHVTHLFNAMGALHHREPGLAGAALTDDRLTCDLICDGDHVAPRMVALAARAKPQRLLLITDRIDPPAGGHPSFGSGALHDDGTAIRLEDGRLAGSRLGLDEAVRNAQRFASWSLHEAVAACTLRPARVLGMEGTRGTLRPGATADLVVLDAEAAVRETWVAGRRVFEREPSS